MKQLIILVIIFCSFQLQADKPKCQLTITVQNISSVEGSIRAALYDCEGNFLKTGQYTSSTINESKEAVLVFEGIEQGKYAVSIFHDENNNGELDTIVFGIPSEPYGFSNDASGSFGPPTFEDSRIELNQNKTITITLN